MVCVSGQLDAAVIPVYSIVIVASDSTFSSTTTLQIQVIDMDDSPVQFTETNYIVGINENSPIGSQVVQ